MPDIVFERFADYLIKKIQHRKSYVKRIVNQKKYDPVEDYYLKLRQRLISLLKKQAPLSELDNIIKNLTPKRIDNYEFLIYQIQLFLKYKKYCWVTPPRNQVDYADLSLIVNPEIGLKIEDEEFFIKMYFKKPDLKKDKVDILLKIMQDAYKEEFPNANFAVWDVRRGSLYQVKASDDIRVSYNFEQEAKNWLKYATEE